MFIGKKLIYMPECHSTNTWARNEFSHNDLPEGTVVLTDHQTAGRGQRGNIWTSEKGTNLTFSIILRPKFLEVSKQFSLTVLVSLAIAEVVAQYAPESTPAIKWPNDILVGDQKIAGILIENMVKNGALECAIIGIGLNVNQSDFGSYRATSLFNLSGSEFSLEAILEDLAHQIEIKYLQLKSGYEEALLEAYHTRLYRKGTWHAYEYQDQPIQGRIQGVAADGTLTLETTQGKIQPGFKELKYFL